MNKYIQYSQDTLLAIIYSLKALINQMTGNVPSKDACFKWAYH